MTSLRSSCRRLRMPVLILPLCCVAFLSPRPARAADAPWEQDSPARPVLTPGALGMRSGPTEDVAPGAAPVPRTYFASPGTTFDDLVRQGILPDPRERPRAHTQVDLDPGAYPEGDNIGWAAFTRDGARVLLTNRDTDNVTVYDSATRQVITNIPVGGYPSGIAVTDDYAVIASPFENRVCILDLDTYDIVGFAPTGVQPWVVRISPDQATAYVACDISNTLEVIDIATATRLRTVPDFPLYLNSWTVGSENGRVAVQFADFELTPDGAYALVADGEVSTTFYFFNTATGQIDHTVEGIPNGRALALSGDGTKAVLANLSDPVSVWQIDLATHAVTGTVSIPGYQLGYLSVGANQDGSKAFLGVTNNMGAVVRFATSDYHLFSATYTPQWIGSSPDHAWAISGHYRFSILDYASESILGYYEGNPQYGGAVSPVGFRVVAFDPNRHEGLYFYGYPGGVPSYLGTTNAGLDPEGDCPHRVAITPDGTKAIVGNVLSDNVVVIDLAIPAVVATLPAGDRPQDVAITPDSRWAVVGAGYGLVTVIDLATATVAASVPAGVGPVAISLSPDGSEAYVGNTSSNTVSIIALSGPTSHEVAELPVGEIGVLWAAYGVWSDVEASPDGRYCLVATSFENVVKVIDTLTRTVVASVPVGNFPLQIAFDADGSHAIVTNTQGNSYSVLRVDGAASYRVGTFAHGLQPLRLDHDPAHNRTAIGNFQSKTVSLVNPETGALLASQSYSAYGYIDQVIVDETGEPIVLTSTDSTPPGYLVRGTDAVPLLAAPAYFDYSPASRTAVVAESGPDWVTIVTFPASGAPEVARLPLGQAGLFLSPAPNPASDRATVRFHLPSAGSVQLEVIDAAGRSVDSRSLGWLSAGRHEQSWTPPSAGLYFVRILVDGSMLDAKKLVVLER